jgi:hypothetical protein
LSPKDLFWERCCGSTEHQIPSKHRPFWIRGAITDAVLCGKYLAIISELTHVIFSHI